jgi:hypothetical protein
MGKGITGYWIRSLGKTPGSDSVTIIKCHETHCNLRTFTTLTELCTLHV